MKDEKEHNETLQPPKVVIHNPGVIDLPGFSKRVRAKVYDIHDDFYALLRTEVAGISIGEAGRICHEITKTAKHLDRLVKTVHHLSDHLT